MSKQLKSLLFLVVPILFTVFVGGCASTPPPENCLPSVTVKVDCSIPDAEYVCVNKGGMVVWDEKGTGTAGAKRNFFLKFKNDTPLRIFNTVKKYEVLSAAGTSSTEQVGTNAPSGTYKYSLSCENGSSVDPMIRVP